MTLRQRLLKFRLVRFLASVRLTVVCLLLLFILTLGGTVAQVQEGLFAAQQRYFESFFFLLFGFLPFPGAQTVMWVLFFNLISAALTRFVFRWRYSGILIIHAGLLFFLVSGYVTLHGAQESHLTLKEGQAANVSTAYHDWELAVWEPAPPDASMTTAHEITALDTGGLTSGQTVLLADLGMEIRVEDYYRNCEARGGRQGAEVVSPSGLTGLEPVPLFKEPERNTPGGLFTVRTADQQSVRLLLYGEDKDPAVIKSGGKTYAVRLRLKRYVLPFTLRLKDFKKEEHPGTGMARSFQSIVEIQVDRAWREKIISMNEPLRYKDFTFYQASFAVDQRGGEASTLAVVRNAGRWMPYVSTGVTFLGLALHFCMMAVISKRRKR